MCPPKIFNRDFVPRVDVSGPPQNYRGLQCGYRDLLRALVDDLLACPDPRALTFLLLAAREAVFVAEVRAPLEAFLLLLLAVALLARLVLPAPFDADLVLDAAFDVEAAADAFPLLVAGSFSLLSDSVESGNINLTAPGRLSPRPPRFARRSRMPAPSSFFCLRLAAGGFALFFAVRVVMFYLPPCFFLRSFC